MKEGIGALGCPVLDLLKQSSLKDHSLAMHCFNKDVAICEQGKKIRKGVRTVMERRLRMERQRLRREDYSNYFKAVLKMVGLDNIYPKLCQF